MIYYNVQEGKSLHDLLKKKGVAESLIEKEEEIRKHLDIKKELDLLGIKIIKEQFHSGWVTVSNPFDNYELTASVYLGEGIYRGYLMRLDKFACKRSLPALSFWELVLELIPEIYKPKISYTDILIYYFDKVMVSNDKKNQLG